MKKNSLKWNLLAKKTKSTTPGKRIFREHMLKRAIKASSNKARLFIDREGNETRIAVHAENLPITSLKSKYAVFIEAARKVY